MQLGHVIWRCDIAGPDGDSDVTFCSAFGKFDRIANQIDQYLTDSRSIAQCPSDGVRRMDIQVKVDVGVRGFCLEHADDLSRYHLGLAHS